LTTTGAEDSSTVEIVAAEPDYIRDAVCAALSSLPEDQRSKIRRRLLNDLRKAGLRVRESLLMLGASARTADELTAPEIAALIRYVRLTRPKIMQALAQTLRELLTIGSHGARIGKAA
jgi:hypothetical protein